MLMDEYQAIVGLGCPGYEPFKDSMEVTMKIKNFQCDYMSTVFTDGVFKDLDLNELTKTTNQLNHHHRNLQRVQHNYSQDVQRMDNISIHICPMCQK